MGPAVDRLTSLVDSADLYDLPIEDLRSTQIEAANELFQEKVKSIRLLENRAESLNIRAVGDLRDIVPLLFAHTAYKGYPQSWLVEGRWDRLCRWLDTVSAYRVEGIDTHDVNDIDDWLERLAGRGHYLSCSSGTTGKISMITASIADRAANKRIGVNSFKWATGIRPEKNRHVFFLNPSGNNFRNNDTTGALAEAYAAPGCRHQFGAHITIGQTSRMVTLRRSITEGAPQPEQIAAFQALAAERQKAMDDAIRQAAEAMVAHRGEKLLLIGQFPMLYRVAQAVRRLGWSRGDFHPDNALMVGGGLKGAALPPDYRDYILETVNIRRKSVYHLYAMQEINTHLPRCRAGRYHVAPWLILLLLDANGKTLLDPAKGEMEGRAGFLDLTTDGRWGGVITGDRVRVDHGKCACGHAGPTISSDIVRYADLPGGDHITCAGTIDAYVRGVA